MKNHIVRILRSVNWDAIILVVTFLVIGNYLFLAFFNHPIQDDFVYALYAKKLGLWESQVYWWNNWSGRYIASFLIGSNPLYFNSFNFFWIYPCVLITGLWGSVFFLISKLFHEKGELYRKVILTNVIFFIYITLMPKVSTGFYWLSGAATYMTGNIFFPVLIGAIQAFEKKKPLSILLYVFLILVSSFVIAGSNEISAALTVLFLLFSLILNWMKTERIHFPLVFALLVITVFTYVSFTAPGNFQRAGDSMSFNSFLSSIFKSIVFGTSFFITSLSSATLLISTVILLPVLHYFKARLQPMLYLSQTSFYIFLLAWLGIVVAGFFMTHFSSGVFPPPRALNNIYFFWLMGWFILIINLLFLWKDSDRQMTHYSMTYKSVFSLLFLVFVNTGNTQEAFRDIYSNRAYEYSVQTKERYLTIINSSADTVSVVPYTNPPNTLFFTDFRERAAWNDNIAEFFGKKRLQLKGKTYDEEI